MGMVYDISNIRSFDNISRWVKNVKDYADENVVKMIVGNKTDLEEDKRLISKNRGEHLAINSNMDFIETSAKSGEKDKENQINKGPSKVIEVNAPQESNGCGCN